MQGVINRSCALVTTNDFEYFKIRPSKDHIVVFFIFIAFSSGVR